MLPGYRARLLRALKLDPTLFEEVEADTTATRQAVFTVVLSSFAAGLSGVSGGLPSLLTHMAAALVGWVAWAYLTYFIGTQLLPEPQTKSNLGEMLRCTGFASAPGLLQVFGFIPGLGPVIRLVASVWMLAAFVVAVRQALDYSSTVRAVGVCVIGWLVWIAISAVLFMLSLGSIAL